MTDIKVVNKAFYRATVFCRSLCRAGVKHIIISPGSRSTPLTMAAAALPALEKHVILDERSAAFFALGIGKATQQPAALICTSGTAVANYFPAVIEAKMSGVPLLLLTADRPPGLVRDGANQAIDQQNIFGTYPVFYKYIKESEPENPGWDELSAAASQAVSAAIEQKGAAHINFPFSKPLEPEPAFVASVVKENSSILRAEAPLTRQNEFSPDKKIIKAINEAESPLIIAGQLTPQSNLGAIFNLAEKLNVPVLSEQGYPDTDYAVQGFEGFLRNDDAKDDLSPDLILRFGRQPASKSLLQAITYWNPRQHIYFSDSVHASDIAHTNTFETPWNGQEFNLQNITNKQDRWLQQWKDKEKNYRNVSDDILDQQTTLTDGHIYHHLGQHIPVDWYIFFSNSFAARDRSMFGRWKTQNIYTNRGVSGIDGITSTAMGINAALHQPGILFTGDLAFLHDTNALLSVSKLKHPLVIVVINNRGGSIFRMLPIAEHEAYFSTYFETPQQVDIKTLCQSYGMKCKTVTSISELKNIDLPELAAQTSSKVCVLECKTDPNVSMEIRNKLWKQP